MAYLGRKGAAAPINASDIPDDSITSAKIVADAVGSSDLAPDIALTGGSVTIPSVTTANRPGEAEGTNASQTATVGMIIYNSTLGVVQQYNVTGWASIDSPPTISSFTYPDSGTALDPAGVFTDATCDYNNDPTITHDTNSNMKQGMAVSGTGIPAGATIASVTSTTAFELSASTTGGAVTNGTLTFNAQTLVITGTNFQTGVTVTIDGTAPSTVSRDSSTQITVTGTPAKSAATYAKGLVVTNPTGLAASADIAYDAIPAWTTAAGSLGSFADDGGSGGSGAYTNSGTVIRIVAAEALDTIDYAQTNSAGVINTDGVAGLVLGTTGANAGYLTGTLDGDESSTYNFYAKAQDDEGQFSAVRLFNIISRPAYSTQQLLLDATNLTVGAGVGSGTPTTEVTLSSGTFRSSYAFFDGNANFSGEYNHTGTGPNSQYNTFNINASVYSVLGDGTHGSGNNFFGAYSLGGEPNRDIWFIWDLYHASPSVKISKITGNTTWGTGSANFELWGRKTIPPSSPASTYTPTRSATALQFTETGWTKVIDHDLTNPTFDTGFQETNKSDYRYYAFRVIFDNSATYDWGLDAFKIYGDYY